MEARCCRLLLVLAALSVIAAGRPNSGTTVRTRNFVVTAPTQEIAKQVADAAEVYRRDIAIEWLGQELLPWFAPCPIFVKVGQIGAGGATTFSFHPSQNGPDEVCGWDMKIQGSLERILDSVLPHEISHTIFACYFRRPLPRWADEGAATLIEHESERRRQVMTVRQVLNTSRRIPLKTLLALKEYPKDMQDVMTLYAEGYSLADLLVQKGGKARYLKFLNDAHQRGWEKAIQAQYSFKGVDDLEKQWHEWIVAGSPPLKLPEGQQLAQTGSSPKNAVASGFELRGQSPEVESPRGVAGDPFLDGHAVSTESARERGSAPERQNSKGGRGTPAVAVVVHEDWIPDDDRNAPQSPVSAEVEEYGSHWVDVPRSTPRELPRGTAARRSQGHSAKNASIASTATSGRSANEIPSAIRIRQSQPNRMADNRDRVTLKSRTPWSEFPQEGPFGRMEAIEAD